MSDFAAERDAAGKIMAVVVCVGIGCGAMFMLNALSALGTTGSASHATQQTAQRVSGCSPEEYAAAENYVETLQNTGFVTSMDVNGAFEVSVDEHTWRLTPFGTRSAIAIALSCHLSNGDSKYGPLKFLSSTTNRQVALYSFGSIRAE